MTTNLQQQAYKCLVQRDYYQASSLYEQAITEAPTEKSNYWYLGLALLLQGQGTEAQSTWLFAMMEGDAEEVEKLNAELMQVLQAEAERYDNATNWVIRQQMREIQPQSLDNLLHLIQLSIKQETFTGEELTDWGVIEILQTEPCLTVDPEWLLDVLKEVLNSAPIHPAMVDFTAACLPHLQHLPSCLSILIEAVLLIAFSLMQPRKALKLAELGLRLDSANEKLLLYLSTLYQDTGNYDQGIAMAEKCYTLAQTLPNQIFAKNLVLRGLMDATAHWEKALSVSQQIESLLTLLQTDQIREIDRATVIRLYACGFFFPYLRDLAPQNREVVNQVAQWIYVKEKIEPYCQRAKQVSQQSDTKGALRIGYLSSCMRRHSVGWLARWLFEYHNHERFQIHGYFVAANSHQFKTNRISDTLHEWYVNHVDKANLLKLDPVEITDKIHKDEIDILVDLDSLTNNLCCRVMAYKPAPVQVTWLGWDASGIPTIDYYIADPYVLPADAQDYYTEKIWRLPHTCIAVDGFEVGVPTLRREQLDIPNDAVVYLSSQRGYKRHPETARWQMRILKAVPNSYFLIKGVGAQESIKSFFHQIAAEEGVDMQQLRFLPEVPSEALHRGNLTVADIVLDTYPYNGATTTVETLWMCIPLVTRVGEQFAARNSYTMMMNAGVTEGIAWTDEEYIEWGVRLGKDEALRQQISWKLQQSRKTAPLWNGRQFTRDMEQAYEQMWQIYLNS